MKKELSVYTHSMTTIYLSLSAQVAISTFFMKSPLAGEEENRRASISLQKLCCVLYLMNFWKPQKIIYEYVFIK